MAFVGYPILYFTLVVAIILLIPHRRRYALAEWLWSHSPLPARGRRDSRSITPPRSLSSEKDVSNNAPPSADYTDILPPSQRDTLHKAAEQYSKAPRARLLSGRFDEISIKENIIPFTADYRHCGPSICTPTGFSMEELKTLGDFPDYAELSGVPLPDPYLEFRIETALARPYRPFRWAYHQTMSLTRMDTNWWLELEHSYVTRIRERKALFAQHGAAVLAYLPGSELACKEVMEMALQFLCARYPQYFSIFEDTDKGFVFQNGILNTETVINTIHPLHVLLENVPEDFACMLRNSEDGCYYFRGGIVCSSLGWSVASKIGMQLKEIHAPIPEYKDKMEFSMDRYFAKMPSARPIQRGSWGLEVGKPLFMPPNDPHEALRLSQNPTLPLSSVHLRVDWQTLRRLPLSAAIVFNFKALFTPISAFRTEPCIPALLHKVLCEGKESIMEYKNTWHVEHVAIPSLERWKREQEENGMTEKGWTEETLAESPFFRGWEEKWRGEQGF